MKASDIIKSVMGQRGLTQGDLTTMMNLKSQSAVSGSLNRDMKTSTLVKFLSCMDCELIVRDKASGTEHTITE